MQDADRSETPPHTTHLILLVQHASTVGQLLRLLCLPGLKVGLLRSLQEHRHTIQKLTLLLSDHTPDKDTQNWWHVTAHCNITVLLHGPYMVGVHAHFAFASYPSATNPVSHHGCTDKVPTRQAQPQHPRSGQTPPAISANLTLSRSQAALWSSSCCAAFSSSCRIFLSAAFS